MTNPTIERITAVMEKTEEAIRLENILKKVVGDLAAAKNDRDNAIGSDVVLQKVAERIITDARPVVTKDYAEWSNQALAARAQQGSMLEEIVEWQINTPPIEVLDELRGRRYGVPDWYINVGTEVVDARRWVATLTRMSHDTSEMAVIDLSKGIHCPKVVTRACFTENEVLHAYNKWLAITGRKEDLK